MSKRVLRVFFFFQVINYKWTRYKYMLLEIQYNLEQNNASLKVSALVF